MPRVKSKVETTTSTTTPKKEEKKSFSERIGISHETLKPFFDRTVNPEGKLKKFHDTLNARIKDGRTRALKDYKAWAAVDLAFRTPFTQITPMILSNIMESKCSAAETLAKLEAWGLSEHTLFVDGIDEKGQPCKYLNESTFYKILLPTVITYSEAREAKLYNDRDQFPLLKYEPFNSTVENSLIAESLTNIFEKQGHQMGDRYTLKRVIKHGIKYGTVLAFPMEAWYSEKSTLENGDEYCVKEGLRYQIPHPTRMFWDLSHPPCTFNTDTGCDYAGYWRTMRWGDIEGNPLYWNLNKVSYGRTDWGASFKHYFSEVYPCTMKFPTFSDSTKETSREASNNYYTTGDHDKACMVTDVFWKLVPKDWGIGDYKYPVWIRFVVASDDTVIFAEPLPYSAVLYLGLDVDENQTQNASFALKIVPFGVHMGNILSQIVLSLKNNATKIVAYDEKQLSQTELRSIKNRSEDVSKTHWIPFDPTKNRNSERKVGDMLVPLQLPQQPIAEQTNTLNMFISVMERMLGISPQEVGAAAVHVTTAEESRILAGNSSQRVDFSGTHVDDFLDAWKKQKYFAAMAFMDDEFTAEVSGNKDYVEVLKKLGFNLVEKTGDTFVIDGDKSKLRLEGFVSIREGKNRINNPQIAQVLLQTISVVAGNQILAQYVGPKQIIDWINRATELAGGSRDAKFAPQEQTQQNQEQVVQQLQAQLEEMNQKLQEAQSQIQTDQIKAQAELEKAKIQAEKDLIIAEGKNATTVKAAQITAAGRASAEVLKSEKDLIEFEKRQSDEAKQAEKDRRHEAQQANLDRQNKVKIARVSKRPAAKK